MRPDNVASSVETELSTFDSHLDLDSRPLLGSSQGYGSRLEAGSPEANNDETDVWKQPRLASRNPICRATAIVFVCVLLGTLMVSVRQTNDGLGTETNG